MTAGERTDHAQADRPRAGTAPDVGETLRLLGEDSRAGLRSARSTLHALRILIAADFALARGALARALVCACVAVAFGGSAWLLARLRHIVGEENFTVNEKKTRVQRRNTQQSVTGIVVNEHPNISRDTVRRIRAILHRARTGGLAAQNRDNHPAFEAWLVGMIAYIKMVNPARGAELKAEFDALRPA